MSAIPAGRPCPRAQIRLALCAPRGNCRSSRAELNIALLPNFSRLRSQSKYGSRRLSSYAIRNAGVEIIVKTLDLAAQPLRLLEEAEQLRLEIESRSSAATPAGFPG
jgi:hypothetical protein